MGNCDGLLAEQIRYNIDVSIKKPSFLGRHILYTIPYSLFIHYAQSQINRDFFECFYAILVIAKLYCVPSTETVSCSSMPFCFMISYTWIISFNVQSVWLVSLQYRDVLVMPIMFANSSADSFNCFLISFVVISSPHLSLNPLSHHNKKCSIN